MISISQVELADILPLRQLYLAEMNTQIRYNACHERSWSDSYLLSDDSQRIGYLSVKGLDDLAKRNTVFEMYLIPTHRQQGRSILDQFLSQSSCTHVEAQSNDPFLSNLLAQVCSKVSSETLLFEFDRITDRNMPGVGFRKVAAGDDVFGKKQKDIGEYVLEKDGLIVADGGILFHYNKPFADLYMETSKENRRRGFGSYIVQELIKVCFQQHRIPAARCQIKNIASQYTLLRGGLRISGHMLIGTL